MRALTVLALLLLTICACGGKASLSTNPEDRATQIEQIVRGYAPPDKLPQPSRNIQYEGESGGPQGTVRIVGEFQENDQWLEKEAIVSLQWDGGGGKWIITSSVPEFSLTDAEQQREAAATVPDLLKFVPDAPGVSFLWIDDKALLEAAGLSELRGLDNAESFGDKWKVPSLRYVLFDGLREYAQAWREESGLDIIATTEHLTIYVEGFSIQAMKLPVDREALVEKLEGQGYVRQEYKGDEFWVADPSEKLAFKVSMMNIWVGDGVIVASNGRDELSAALDSYAGRTRSLRDREDLIQLASALSPFHGMLPLSDDNMGSAVKEAVLGANATREQNQAYFQTLREQYPDWGEMPQPNSAMIAYLASGDGGTMKIALAYSSTADASDAAAELAVRLKDYKSLLSFDVRCERSSAQAQGNIVVAECSGGPADYWLGIVLTRDTLFLADNLNPP